MPEPPSEEKPVPGSRRGPLISTVSPEDEERGPLTLSPALETKEGFSLPELRELWMILSPSERVEAFRLLPRADSEEFFLELHARDHAELLLALPVEEQRAWMRLLPPDDAADLAQAAPPDQRERLLALLDEPTRKEVNALLAYAEDEAGGLMNPRFARVRPDATVDEAITYLRRQARERLGSIYYVYVLDEQQRLRGVVSFRQLFSAATGRRVADIMHRDVLSVREDQDQEEVSNLFAQHGFAAIPVVDAENRVKGIVTMDDIVEVVQEEATEDAQKMGGLEALDAPYLQISFRKMLQKRAGWLAALFLGEMLTATAMSHFEDEIARAVVLALFVPLIISSGGNSGSQASTLVIRAMALEEVKLRDWWRVMRRELAAGVALGCVLGTIGFLRIVLWQSISPMYGEHYLLIAMTVFGSLIGVVMFGTLAGSLLPFLLRRLGLDPASASAPFVATLVDVTGLIIYFSVASIILRGTLLAEATTTKQVVQQPFSALQWTPLAPGAPILAANAWKGPGGSHCQYTKFPRGFSEPKHSHTSDQHVVVLEGQWGVWAPGAVEQYVSAGGYQFISGGTEHLAKCGPSTDCVVYDCGPAAYDIQGLEP